MKKVGWLLSAMFCLALLGVDAAGQDRYRSKQSGNWTAATTWEISTNGGGSFNNATTTPGNAPTDVVLVRNNHTVNNNAKTLTIGQLTVGEGASGNLAYSGSFGGALTVTGNVVVASGGTLDASGLSGKNGLFSLILGGNLTVNGTFNLEQTATRRVAAVINAASDVQINGTPSLLRFGALTVNLGSATNTLSVSANLSTTVGISLIQGRWIQNSATTTTVGDWSIGANGELAIGGGTVTVNDGSMACSGKLTVSGGTLNIGNTDGDELRLDQATSNLQLSGGAINIASCFNHGQFNAASIINISGGTMTVTTVNNTSAMRNDLEIGSSANFTMSAGTIVIQRAASSALAEVFIASPAPLAGGSLQIGNGATPAGSVIDIDSAAALRNVSVNSANATAKVVNHNLVVQGDVTVSSGVLDSNGFDISLQGNWSNSGTFTPGSGTVTFNGAVSQTLSGSAATFGKLTVNNSAGVTLNSNVTVNTTLALVSGTASTGANTLSIAAAGTVSRTSGHVIGNLKKSFSAIGSKIYELGTANGYSPATVTIAGAGLFPKACTVAAIQGPQPRIPNTTKALQRYWRVTGPGGTVNLMFQYLDPTDIPATANESNFQVVKVTGAVPAFPAGGAMDAAANTASITDSSPGFGGATTITEWTVSEPFSPTAVDLAAFQASRYERGVVLEWQTGYEVNNLGFNLYREQGGKRVKVNPSLIAGSALMAGPRIALTAGMSYAWADRAATDAGEAQYWLEDVDLNGKSTWHGPISPMPGGKLSSPADALLLRNMNSDAATSQQTIVSRAMPGPLVKAAGKSIGVATDPRQPQWDIVAQACVKLAISKDGWYRITQPELVAAGLDPSRDPFFLKLYTDALEVPILVNGGSNGRLEPGDAIEFYGTSLDTPNTDVRTYYLVSSNQAGRRIPSVSSGKAQPGGASYAATIERKDRSIYFIGLKNGDADNWFGPILTSQAVTQTLTVPHKDAKATGDAMLEIALQGVTDADGATPDHSVQVSLNGQVIGTITFDGQAHQVSSLSVNQAVLQEGDNPLTLVAQNGSMDVSLLDYVRLTYAHTYAADSDRLPFTATGGTAVEVSGFSSSAVRVADVTDTGNVQMLNSTVSAQGGAYTLSVITAGSGARTLYAFADSLALHPASITANQPSTLNLARQGADVVMIAHHDFIPSLAPLLTHRNGQGYGVAVVDVEDVYDEFSYGARSPQAIKDFLLLAKTVWKRTPRFVLLMGDASYDPHNYLGLGDHDFVPSKQIATATMETASDDWLVDFNNDGLPELAIGRLPARTAAEATTLVMKIINYEQQGQVEGAVLVADRNDGFDFEGASAAVRALLPDNVAVQQVYRSQMDDQTAHNQIVNLLNRGPKLLNYAGHGSFGLWRGNLLTSADAGHLTNQSGLTFIISMTCLNGQFQDPYSDGLAESLLKAADGGAVGIWASSALTQPDGQAAMNQAAIWQIFNGADAKGRPLTLGEAVMRAKAATTDSDVRRSWVLLGDPLTRLR